MAESLSTDGFTKGMVCGSNGEGERESDQLIFFGGSEDPGSNVGVSELESEGQLPKKPRKKEHSYKEKKKLIDNSQKKITDYVEEVSPPLSVSNESLLSFPPKRIS